MCSLAYNCKTTCTQLRQFILIYQIFLIQYKNNQLDGVIMVFLEKIKQIKYECKNEFDILKEMTCCFTGHRWQKLPWGQNEDDERCKQMKLSLKEEIIDAVNKGYKYFISGMALGFDIIAAETIIKLKKDYPQIKVIAALPCKDQYKLWKDNQIERYKDVLSKCDEVRCLYDTYNDKCMLERNDYMLNNSSFVIALYNGEGGGTGYTIRKAKEKGLKIKIMQP